MSPAMVAAAAVAGEITDVREMLGRMDAGPDDTAGGEGDDEKS